MFISIPSVFQSASRFVVVGACGLVAAFCFSDTSFVSTSAVYVRYVLASTDGHYTPNLASNSFILRRLDPKFLRRSGYSHSCRNREQVPHFGFTRSHFNFLLRHDTHDIVFSEGLPSPVVVGPAAGRLSSGFEPDDAACAPVVGGSAKLISGFADIKSVTRGILNDKLSDYEFQQQFGHHICWQSGNAIDVNRPRLLSRPP